MNIRKLALLILVICVIAPVSTFAQKDNKKEELKFTDIKRLPTTSVKNQYRAGTCWSWSTLSFIESEMIRIGKEQVDLSAMYVVWESYKGKAEKYVRLHGNMNFAGGGAICDIPWCIKNHGIVPLEVYKGLNYGTDNHVHGEMDAVLKKYVEGVVENKNKKLSTAWMRGYEGILNAYLGEIPEKFTFKGKEYTPQSFAKEAVGLDMDDYVLISSYKHHPFYKPFGVTVPDNWLWGEAYNLPLEEMMETMDNAIENGYTIAWASDISEAGFNSRAGYAVVPEDQLEDMAGLEMAKWEKTGNNAKVNKETHSTGNMVITQDMRQKAYDNYETTDDHGMHIVGKAKDQNGKDYFIVKNSWGEYNKYKGYFYASYPFVAYKTMNFMVHKDAIPKKIRKKLGIK